MCLKTIFFYRYLIGFDKKASNRSTSSLGFSRIMVSKSEKITFHENKLICILLKNNLFFFFFLVNCHPMSVCLHICRSKEICTSLVLKSISYCKGWESENRFNTTYYNIKMYEIKMTGKIQSSTFENPKIDVKESVKADILFWN